MVGFSLFAIALGAILRFAVDTSVAGIDIAVVGVILMVVGGIGLVLGVALETDGGGQTAGRDV
jgi:hypothetical protein